MKRILIVNNNMHIGGVQKALLNLLQTLHADYDITLLLFYRGGALLNEVPSDVRVCAADGAFRYFGMTKNDVSTVRDRLLRTFWAGTTRVLGMPFSTRLACLLQKRIQGFDAAISFFAQRGCTYVLWRVQCVCPQLRGCGKEDHISSLRLWTDPCRFGV